MSRPQHPSTTTSLRLRILRPSTTAATPTSTAASISSCSCWTASPILHNRTIRYATDATYAAYAADATLHVGRAAGWKCSTVSPHHLLSSRCPCSHYAKGSTTFPERIFFGISTHCTIRILHTHWHIFEMFLCLSLNMEWKSLLVCMSKGRMSGRIALMLLEQREKNEIWQKTRHVTT